MPGTMKQKQQKTTKFWNVAKTNGHEAEITLYGDICSEAPRDWWTGEKIDGQYITPEGFLEDLEVIKDSPNITVKLNSCGGDLYTGIAIHNALKSLKGTKNVVVEGIAASAASVIMCAGDNVSVYPGSLIMIHGVSSLFWDYMNLEDLKKSVDAFEASENAIAEIYAVKTGLSVNKLRSMMTKETWMTGSQAVDNGFANEVIGGVETEFNYLNKNILMINGIKHDVSGLHIPKNIMNEVIQQQGKKGGNQPMNDFQKFLLAMQNCMTGFIGKTENNANAEGEEGEGSNAGANVDPVKTEEQKIETVATQPAVAEQPEAAIQKRIQDAVMAERNRLQEIDEMPPGVSDELKNAAKYGEKACDAKELAFQALQKQHENNGKQLENLKKDTDKSGAQNVNSAQSQPDSASEDDQKIAQAKQFAAERKARKEGKK